MSLSALESIRDLVELDIKDTAKVDVVSCLREKKLTEYHLIISHPHSKCECDFCVPGLEFARKNNIPIVITYKIKNHRHTEEIETISQGLNLQIEHTPGGARRDVYTELINKYLK